MQHSQSTKDKMKSLSELGFSSREITKLTCEEYEKLQTVPIGYTASVAPAQRYKMLGNGWTVDVISHILKGIK